MAKAQVYISVAGNADLRAFEQAQRELDTLKKKASEASGGMSQSFTEMGKKFTAFGDKASAVGGTMTKYVTAPLLGIAAVGAKVAMDFETTMNQMQVASGASGKQMQELSKLAIKMGADTIYSANEAGAAMLELSKGGMSVAEIKGGALQSTMALAAASGMALADAGTTISAAMNTFGLKAGNAAEITDALAGAANASAADVSSLAQGLQQVGQQAAASGFSVQETTAALAAFADAGVQGSDAGTSLKTFLQRLVPASEDASKAMDKLGLSFFDSKGNMKDLEGIATTLQKNMKDLTQEERLSYMNRIFGSDATRAANILFNQGAEGIRKYTDATSEQGNAQKMADARMKGTAGAIEAMKGSLETVALLIGQKLAPYITKAAKFVAELANKFGELSPMTQNIIVGVGAFLAVLGPAILVAGKFAQAIGSIMTVAPQVINFLKTSSVLTKIWTGIQAAFNFVMSMNPIALVVIAIAALVAILVVAYKKSDTFRKIVDGAFQKVKDVMMGVFNWVKKNWPLLLGILTGPIGMAVILITKHWDQIKTTVLNAVTKLRDMVVGPLQAIKTTFTNVFNGVKSFLTNVFDGYKNMFKGLINFIIQGMNFLVRGLNKIHFSVPDWVPAIGGKSFGFNLPEIPALAKGGIVSKPTIALIGEAGPEAVVPLSRGGGAVGGVTIQNLNVGIPAGMAAGDAAALQRAVREGVNAALIQARREAARR